MGRLLLPHRADGGAVTLVLVVTASLRLADQASVVCRGPLSSTTPLLSNSLRSVGRNHDGVQRVLVVDVTVDDHLWDLRVDRARLGDLLGDQGALAGQRL